MRELVIKHIREVFEMYGDLAEHLPSSALGRKLPVRSNTLGEQFWCLVGARESYTRAIELGAWGGFCCSMSAEGTRELGVVRELLARSADDFDRVAGQVEWNAARLDLLLKLLEHEVQHQGQMVRYVYGLGCEFPKSWRERWSLS